MARCGPSRNWLVGDYYPGNSRLASLKGCWQRTRACPVKTANAESIAGESEIGACTPRGSVLLPAAGGRREGPARHRPEPAHRLGEGHLGAGAGAATAAAAWCGGEEHAHLLHQSTNRQRRAPAAPWTPSSARWTRSCAPRGRGAGKRQEQPTTLESGRAGPQARGHGYSTG